MTLTVLKLGCDELSRLGVTRFTRKSNRSMCFDQGFIRVGGGRGIPPKPSFSSPSFDQIFNDWSWKVGVSSKKGVKKTFPHPKKKSCMKSWTLSMGLATTGPLLLYAFDPGAVVGRILQRIQWSWMHHAPCLWLPMHQTYFSVNISGYAVICEQIVSSEWEPSSKNRFEVDLIL